MEKIKYKNIVWEGRFQPIHKGHLEYIKKLVSISDNLWLIILANELSIKNNNDSASLPLVEFSLHIDQHHRKEKNPLPLWLRYLLAYRTINKEIKSPHSIYLLIGHRWDLDWTFYKNNLPPERVFAIPTRDKDDDKKEEALVTLGEKCIRIDVTDIPSISATLVRERIKKGMPLEDILSPYTIATLKEYKYIQYN